MDDFNLDGFMGDLSDDDNKVTTTHSDDSPKSNWVPEEALDNLVEERSMNPGNTNVEVAKKLLEDNAPLAVQSMVQLALYSRSESVRLRASQSVVQLAFEANSAGASALDKFFSSVESLANEKSA